MIAFISILVRAIYLFQLQSSPLLTYHLADQIYYLEWARMILAGEGISHEVYYQGPLYAYLLAIELFVTRSSELLIFGLQMIAGVGTCLMTCACGRRLFDERTALVAGLVAACYGPFVFYEGMLMKTFLSPLLTVSTLYSALRFEERQQTRWLLAAGVSVGAACLLRESHLLLLIPVAIRLWWVSRGTPLGFWVRLSRYASLFGGCALVVLPVTVRNYTVSGEFVVVTAGGGEVLYMAQGPGATAYYRTPPFVGSLVVSEHEDFRSEASRRVGHELTAAESSRFWFAESRHAIASDPLRAGRLILWKAAVLFNDFEVPDSGNYELTRRFVPCLGYLPSFGWLIGLGTIGLLICIRRGGRTVLLVGMLIPHVATVLLTYNFGRFRLGMMPVWILCAAAGGFWFASALRRGSMATSRVRRGMAFAALAVSGLSFLPPLGYVDSHSERDLELLNRWGRLTHRLSDVQEALESRPDNSDLRHELAQLLFQLGRHEESLEAYDALLAANERDTVALRDAAMVHIHFASFRRRSEFPRLVRRLQKAIEVEPESAAVYVRLGIGYFRWGAGHFEPAESAFRQALAIAPDHAGARYNLANLKYHQQRYDEAIPILTELIEEAPHLTVAVDLLNQIHRAASRRATEKTGDGRE